MWRTHFGKGCWPFLRQTDDDCDDDDDYDECPNRLSCTPILLSCESYPGSVWSWQTPASNVRVETPTLLVEYRETNLMSFALLFHYLLRNMFRMLIHPSSGACDLFDELFHGLYCSGSMCVGVTLWFGWAGVVSSALVLQSAYGYHTSPAKPQRNTDTHRTRAIQPMK